MIAVAIGLIVLLLGGALAMFVMASRQIARTAGHPTPKEAEIEAKTRADALVIVNDGERAKQEVQHADRDALLDALRNELRK